VKSFDAGFVERRVVKRTVRSHQDNLSIKTLKGRCQLQSQRQIQTISGTQLHLARLALVFF
jgi:hypothetical protein